MPRDAASTARIHTVSWHEAHRDATDLAARLSALGPWRGAIAISRGGLVPAAIICRLLSIRLVETVCIASYDGRRKGAVNILKPIPAAVGDGAGWLLIDDLVDSGATAGEARRMAPRAHYAALYAKPQGRPLADSFIREVEQDVWIDFPWDRDPALPTTSVSSSGS
ncbi:MAG: xanthine phosphoribosyltransferase [Rhodospirillales bacterium]|nr:xanthine phosphoribosyltransferase [Rhodospirillales bacterium]